MNFYGLWISNTNQEKIQECIESGVWKKDTYPNEENKEYERKKIDKLEIGAKVFLYFASGEVSIAETDFSQYLSKDSYDHSKTIVKVQCPAIGIVKSKNLDDVSLEVEWDKGYTLTEWYMYYRQDGIWRFIDEYDKKLKEALYDIIFNRKKFDFKWWTENLNWYRKKKNHNLFIGITRDDIIRAIFEYVKMKEEGRLNRKREAVSYDLIYNEDYYPHKYILGIAHKIANNTNEILDSSLYNATGGKNSAKRVLEDLGFEVIKRESNDMEKHEDGKIIQPLNQILYGPPGTGKTYHTIDKALQIIDGEVPTNREEAKERFEVLKDAGQIEFVTFHQSYGYEEFVEGIKAIPSGKDGNDSDEMIYDVISGIFRKIAKKALINYSSNGTDIFEVKSFELNAKSLNIQAKMIQDDENTYRVLKDSKIRKDEAPSFSQYNYSTLRNTILKEAKLKEESEFYILQEDYTFQSMSAASSVILGRMSNGLRDWKEIINYDVSVKNNKNHIIIIDEINRGNISKIFGELITLIEESKRLGNDEAMEVTLPYSGEKFGVPKNLYIIGTMNTADRSIALMDTALRRRFEFEEMMPKPELLKDIKVEGIDLVQLLTTINKRIEYLYDRDHTIGHSYFMDVTDKLSLDSAMKNKVMPLLQEYFYDDWEKIRLVLNDGFIKRDIQDASKLFDVIDDEYIEDDKYVYSIASNFALEAYVRIYAKIEHIE